VEIASAGYILEICSGFSTYPSGIWAVILGKDTNYKIYAAETSVGI